MENAKPACILFKLFDIVHPFEVFRWDAIVCIPWFVLGLCMKNLELMCASDEVVSFLIGMDIFLAIKMILHGFLS